VNHMLGSLARKWPPRRPALAIASAVVLAGAVTGGTLAARSPASPHVATVPAGGRASATLEVVSGTRLLSVDVANLGGTGGTLVRASTPDGAPVRPVLRLSRGDGRGRSGQADTVSLTLEVAAGSSTAGNGGNYAVTVTLNAAVTWQLDFGGGTERTIADLRGGRLSGLTFTAGSDVIDATLPRPRGTVGIRLAGGASQFLLSAPRGVPVRVQAAGGAGRVSVDGGGLAGVAGGSVFATPGWQAATARFDVDATAGAADIAVSAWSR
jgi:hypothetical protein